MHLLVAVILAFGMCMPRDVPQEPPYDTSTVINEMATVSDVREVARDEALPGMHLNVKTDSFGPFDVYVGPTEFVKQFEFSVSKGDRIQVKGSRVKFRGADLLLASEVRNQQMTLYLRDSKGVPNWSR